MIKGFPSKSVPIMAVVDNVGGFGLGFAPTKASSGPQSGNFSKFFFNSSNSTGVNFLIKFKMNCILPDVLVVNLPPIYLLFPIVLQHDKAAERTNIQDLYRLNLPLFH